MTNAKNTNTILSRVDRSGDCWLWTGTRNGNGYGQIQIEGKLYKAPRLAWELFRGPIPAGLQVCHKCDVPACVNPDHLFVGTQKDNMRDAKEKGRIPFSGEARLPNGVDPRFAAWRPRRKAGMK